MAEFKDVALGFNRMCNSYSTPPCEGCPMGLHSIDRMDCMSRLFAKPDKYEGRVLKWIEKNPEPVYPTWEEWLYSTYPMMGPSTITDILEFHVPPDIAEKLGIVPKEG